MTAAAVSRRVMRRLQTTRLGRRFGAFYIPRSLLSASWISTRRTHMIGHSGLVPTSCSAKGAACLLCRSPTIPTSRRPTYPW